MWILTYHHWKEHFLKIAASALSERPRFHCFWTAEQIIDTKKAWEVQSWGKKGILPYHASTIAEQWQNSEQIQMNLMRTETVKERKWTLWNGENIPPEKATSKAVSLDIAGETASSLRDTGSLHFPKCPQRGHFSIFSTLISNHNPKARSWFCTSFYT